VRVELTERDLGGSDVNLGKTTESSLEMAAVRRSEGNCRFPRIRRNRYLRQVIRQDLYRQ